MIRTLLFHPTWQNHLLGYIPRIELWFSGVVLGWIVFDGLTR